MLRLSARCILAWAGLRGLIGQAEAEFCAPPDASFGPHPAAVAANDPLHGRQAHPGTGKVNVGMKPLERPEQPVCVIRVEADTIVLDQEDDLILCFVEAKFDFGRVAF